MTLLSIVDPLTDASHILALTRATAVREVVRSRREQLDALAIELAVPESSTVVEELQHGEDVAMCIERVCRREQADLLAVASRKGGTVLGLLVGSVAGELLRRAPCPILVIRPSASLLR